MTNRWTIAILCAVAVAGCEGTSELVSPTGGANAAFAKAGAGKAITVTSADPAYGEQGESGKRVRIIGTGFTPGAVAAWERNGVPDAKVRVLNTTYLSSTELEATIDIAPDAELAFYDISVTSDKGKGVGTERFEVTTAVSIGTLNGNNTQGEDASESENGAQIVGWSGTRAFAWSNGVMQDLGPGVAHAVDVNGSTIAGVSASQAVVWTPSNGSWVKSLLPVAAGAPGSSVSAIASNSDGNAFIIGGSESVVGGRRRAYDRPMFWRRTATGWSRDPLQTSRTCLDVASSVRAVNNREHAAGGVSNCGLPGRPVFWDSLGVPTELDGDEAIVNGIDGTGTIIVGTFNTRAVYWNASVDGSGNRSWTGPHNLPGNCERAIGVDDFGRIVGHRCPSATGSRYTSAAWMPPYESIITLTGLGDRDDSGSVWGISRRGTRVVGRGSDAGGGSDPGALWEGVFPVIF